LFLDAFVANKVDLFNNLYDIRVQNYHFYQLRGLTEELRGPLEGRGPPVEKHCSKVSFFIQIQESSTIIHKVRMSSFNFSAMEQVFSSTVNTLIYINL